MKKASEILELTVDHLHDNIELKQYLYENFGSVGSVQIGRDKNDWPSEKFMPCIMVGPVNRADRGDGKKGIDYLLFLSVTISHEKKLVTQIDNSPESVAEKRMGKIDFAGEMEAIKLLELVESIFYRHKIGGRKDSVGETLTGSDYPLFRASTAFSINYPSRNSSGIQ